MKKIILCTFILFLLIPAKIFAQDYQYLDVKIGKSYSEKEKIKISSKSPIYLVDSDYKKIINLYTDNVIVYLDKNKVVLKNNNMINSKDFSQIGDVMLASDSPIKIDNVYRGYLYFKGLNGKLLIINHVYIEDYLKGVVPKELSATYPLEALKAQAICSRSFALRNIDKYKKYGYNLDDTTNSQVYKGQSAEEEKSNKAVDETKGLYVTYQGKIADTIFGASSGGFIADASDVWGGLGCSYLKAKEDSYSKDYTWDYSVNKSDIYKKLGKSYSGYCDINISEYDYSGRAKKLLITDGTNDIEVSGNKFRSILGYTKIKSTLFTIEDRGEMVYFKGHGYGHGVGMSQYGAVEMAKQGMDYRDIIEFYFPGVDFSY